MLLIALKNIMLTRLEMVKTFDFYGLLIMGIICLLTIPNKLYALDDASFKNGWYWGKDDIKETKEHSEIRNKEHKTIVKSSITKQEILNEIKTTVEETKAAAILNPTVTNVVNYLTIQGKVANMATNFSKTWQKVQLLYPELDYSAKNPTNNYVRQLINNNERENIEKNIYDFAKTKGILFFFNGKDNVATYQSKIIKEFCARYNVAVIPVSMDGVSNQFFTDAARNNGQAQKLNITITPAIIALDIKTKETAPISYGVVTELDLKNKIYNFMDQNYDKVF